MKIRTDFVTDADSRFLPDRKTDHVDFTYRHWRLTAVS